MSRDSHRTPTWAPSLREQLWFLLLAYWWPKGMHCYSVVLPHLFPSRLIERRGCCSIFQSGGRKRGSNQRHGRQEREFQGRGWVGDQGVPLKIEGTQPKPPASRICLSHCSNCEEWQRQHSCGPPEVGCHPLSVVGCWLNKRSCGSVLYSSVL